MSIVYRPGQARDSPHLVDVWAAACGQLNQEHGFPPPLWPGTTNPLHLFAAEAAPDGFWVAEEEGEPIGFAIRFVHESVWY